METFNQNFAQPTGDNNYQPQLSTSKVKRLLYYLAVIILAVLVLWGGYKLLSGSSVNPDNDLYQAVFMSNGEVYFGHITDHSDDYIVLEDIYYLRVTPALQQQPDGTTVQDPNRQPQINLIKLGEELHGPEDRMHIPFHSVVYWENITNEGQVAQVIAQAATAAENGENVQTTQQPLNTPPAQIVEDVPVDNDAVDDEAEVTDVEE